MLRVVGEVILLIAEVEPGMGELVNEQWGGRRYETVVAVNNSRTANAPPADLRNRVRGRADGKEVKHHRLAVCVPAQVVEAGLRPPGQSECIAAVQCPRPVDTVVQRGRITANLLIVEEVGSTGECSGY